MIQSIRAKTSLVKADTRIESVMIVKPGKSLRSMGRGELSPTQREIVRMCEHAVQQMGLSRSMGQIFGVIYSSPEPLAFGEVTAMLDLSKGSISQGLRQLCELEAIRRVCLPGDRRDLYVPGMELKRVLMRLFQARLRMPLEQGEMRLRAIKAQLADSDERESDFLFQRLTVLQTWHRKALRALPAIERSLAETRG